MLLAGLALLAVPVHVPSLRAQPAPDVAPVVARLHAYLDAYEPQLSALVADEEFHQHTHVGVQATRRTLDRRRLVSDVGFLRLPGGLGWLGQRSVREINGRQVSGAARLHEVFAAAGPDVFARARAIALENARHNLGPPRSLNVPTLPLDLLGRRFASAFTVTIDGRDRVRGRDTVRLAFREKPPGALVAHDEHHFSRVDIRAWVALNDGALLRADVSLTPPTPGHHRFRVDFAPDPALGLLVPTSLTESFRTSYAGEGTATYRNYRRFQTAGRLVPQAPADLNGGMRCGPS
jgi:hypothetical protein